VSQVVLETLRARFGPAVHETHAARGDDTALVDRAAILEVVRFLKEDPDLQFNMLIDLFGVDGMRLKGRTARFEVIYHFYSVGKKKHRVRVKCLVPEDDPVVDSITAVWPGANWYERECWDMFGIRFRGHPDLRRILMYEEFEGHPLRKDYPYDKRQPLVGTPH
jgi:NADH-quinone oxidoreductase subunit C